MKCPRHACIPNSAHVPHFTGFYRFQFGRQISHAIAKGFAGRYGRQIYHTKSRGFRQISQSQILPPPNCLGTKSPPPPSGERPIGAAKGKQSDTEALCQPPPVLIAQHIIASEGGPTFIIYC